MDVVQWVMGCSVCCGIWTQQGRNSQAVQQCVCRAPARGCSSIRQHYPGHELQHGSCSKEGAEYSSQSHCSRASLSR